MTKKQVNEIVKKVNEELKNSSSDNITISFLNTNFEFMLTDKNIEQLKSHFNVEIKSILGYVEFKPHKRFEYAKKIFNTEYDKLEMVDKYKVEEHILELESKGVQ